MMVSVAMLMDIIKLDIEVNMMLTAQYANKSHLMRLISIMYLRLMWSNFKTKGCCGGKMCELKNQGNCGGKMCKLKNQGELWG